MSAALAGVFLGARPAWLSAQAAAQQTRQNRVAPESELAQVPLPEPSANALPLPEDRGVADLEQTLKRLGTTASVLMIVPHPDDEDGALLTYLTRGRACALRCSHLRAARAGRMPCRPRATMRWG